MIFKRGKLYLSMWYYWDVIPHVFPISKFGDLLDMFANWKDKPTGCAMVGAGVIDLDAIKWTPIPN